MRTSTKRLLSIFLLAVALGVGACGGDDGGDGSMNPQGSGTVRIPDDAATLDEAIGMVAADGVIEIATPLLQVTTTAVIGSTKSGVTLRGTAGGDRPVLEFMLDADTQDALVVTASGFTLEHLLIRGTFRTAVTLNRSGAEVRDCRIEGGSVTSIACPSILSGALIERNILVGPGVYGVQCAGFGTVTVRRNTIVGAGDCGIYSVNAAPLCERNILVGNRNFGIACYGIPLPSLGCNVLFDNGADYSSQCGPGGDDQQIDPLFCDEDLYLLSPESPCAPANAGDCEAIGAVEASCTPAP